MLHGVDVSNNNGLISLRNIANMPQLDFAIAKATEGTGFRDPDFSTFWAMMKEDKILRGAYHFMNTSDATAQARAFVTKVKTAGLEQNDILCLDVEVNGITNSAVKTCVHEIQRLSGKNVFLYVNYDFLHRGFLSGLEKTNPIWIANPSGRIGAPPSVHPFPVWTIQQYDWKGVDKNVFNGDATTWGKLANLHEPPRLMKYHSKGDRSLVEIATRLDTGPSTILRLTAEHSNPEKEFSQRQAQWINDIFHGKISPLAPVPDKIILTYKK